MEGSKTQGTMTIDFQGNIKDADGVLSKKDFGKTIVYLLEEANVLVEKELKSPFRKVTINFKKHEYAITLDEVSIHVTVRAVEHSKE